MTKRDNRQKDHKQLHKMSIVQPSDNPELFNSTVRHPFGDYQHKTRIDSHNQDQEMKSFTYRSSTTQQYQTGGSSIYSPHDLNQMITGPDEPMVWHLIHSHYPKEIKENNQFERTKSKISIDDIFKMEVQHQSPPNQESQEGTTRNIRNAITTDHSISIEGQQLNPLNHVLSNSVDEDIQDLKQNGADFATRRNGVHVLP